MQLGRSIERAPRPRRCSRRTSRRPPAPAATAASASTPRGRRCCARARRSRRTAALHGRRQAGAAHRVPAAERGMPAVGPVRDRHVEDSLRAIARMHGRNAPGRSIGSPAVCAPRSTSARSTRSWPATCRLRRRASASSASRSHRAVSDLHQLSRPRRRSRMSGEIQYLVRHIDPIRLHAPVSESVMELRMQPLSDGRQRCLRFELTTQPRARVFAYHDRSATPCTTSTFQAGIRGCGLRPTR